MSQIGYMVLAAGLGPIGYVFAIFHLLTHGVFKAGLFLGAGSVMHGMNDNVNMRRYGALRTAMIITYATFIIGTLSIMGIPPFSGFWSKDSIIHAAFESNTLVGVLTIIAAAITGFYMTRMAAMTFFGKARWEDDVHPHESPKVMTIPLIILAIGSTFMGMALLFWGNIETWLEPVVGIKKEEIAIPDWLLMTITLVLVLAGAAYGWIQYARREVPVVAPRGNWLTRAAREDLYGDAVNNTLVVQPSFWLSRFLVWFDGSWIDGLVNGGAAFFGGLSARLRPYQSGFIRSYALSMVGGAVLVVLALVLVRLS
jgi:NADH-quinone oxidoreductase subunit L